MARRPKIHARSKIEDSMNSEQKTPQGQTAALTETAAQIQPNPDKQHRTNGGNGKEFLLFGHESLADRPDSEWAFVCQDIGVATGLIADNYAAVASVGEEWDRSYLAFFYAMAKLKVFVVGWDNQWIWSVRDSINLEEGLTAYGMSIKNIQSLTGKEIAEKCKRYLKEYNKPRKPVGEPANQIDIPIPTGMAALREKEYPPLEFLIDGLIAKGQFGTVAAPPKSGKSFLCLGKAKAVDVGEQFLGRDTRRGKVLYIALEDGDRRIHQRLNILKWHPRHAGVLFDIARFDNGGMLGPGLVQIGGLTEHFDLVIIDTLIAALSAGADENNNTQMGAITNELARIAHDSDTAIVLVHHTNKGSNEDIFKTIRGASAIRGAYDVGFLLERKPDESEAVLHVESRDFEAQSMTLRQLPGGGWEYVGGSYEIHKIRAGRKTMQSMIDHPDHLDGLTLKEIARHSNRNESTVNRQLNTLEEKGYVYRETQTSMSPGRHPDIWFVAEKYRDR